MPEWTPSQIWKDQDAYIIGGGPSLKHFDWECLRDKNTIGCNSAFSLGHEICKVLVFGDLMWWDKVGKKGTEKYGGLVVSACPRLVNDQTPWLMKMQREGSKNGLGKDKLGWMGNTGGLAINLAMIFGCKKIYLLGFDMKLCSKGQANWHDLRYEAPKDSVYKRFIREMRHIKRDIPIMFPGVEIINVTDDSDLPYFKKVGVKKHFQKQEQTCGTE